MSVLSSSKRNLFNTMPQGTVSLFLIQIVSTLSFSVLYSTLVLYMKGKLGLEVTTANSIMGVFIAFNYGLHLLGGVFGGRFLSNRSLFCFGMLAQVIGCFLLSTENSTYLYYGLAAFLTGSGVNVTCLNCMLTQRFTPEDKRRETAFLWNYAGMNIGFFIGFSLSGFFQITQNYQTLFLLSSLGNVMALVLCFFSWNKLADIDTTFANKSKSKQIKARLFGLSCLLLLPFCLSQVLHNSDWASKFVLLTGLSMMVLIMVLAKQQKTKEAKDKMFVFAAFMIVSTVFWMLYQIGPMGLTVFIENNVQREFMSWIIPPQWFQNINTIAIVIGGPLMGVLFNRMRQNGAQLNTPTQFSLALLFIGIAFIILPIGIGCANNAGMVNANWIVASYLLQSIGELLISPIGYAMIGSLAPASLQGLMMGIWMLNTGVGATLSSYSSNLMVAGQSTNSAILTNAGYSQVFLMLGLFAIISSVLLSLFVPKLRALLHENTIEPIVNLKPSISVTQ
jgi:POT family proton-dependent oligopeptide transporter